MARQQHKLSQLAATAVCGNDILSSALYVSGIAILFAGIWAPLVLLGIGVVLYCYKAVYTEVVEALPINGGAYNCLLNATSKTVASIAGITTFLSYVATAVISATVAIQYLATLVTVPIIAGTVVLLGLFALLVISGTKDSATVATVIFVFHIATLTLFVILGGVTAFKGVSYFAENIGHTSALIARGGGLFGALFLAFSASLLGVSGFESSANFVEEQQPGVFRKTLRNMLIGVAIFNPLITLIVLNSMPIPAIAGAKDFLLSAAAFSLGGVWFKTIVVVDAFLVLSGAVLTAYVGVSGLLNRMSSDDCLPQFLRKKNSRGSYPRIILVFFSLCSSILLITGGNLLSLAGVYTIAFLSVMSMFAAGNLILKEYRPDLKRTFHAPTVLVVTALVATIFGIIGNIRIDSQNLTYFEWYFVPALVLMLLVIYQDRVMQIALRLTKGIPLFHGWVQDRFTELSSGKLVAFVREANNLYPILEYIERNETSWNITLVHCKNRSDSQKKFHEIKEIIPQLQRAGVFPHFIIDLIHKNVTFGPEVVNEVAKELKVKKNKIFIGSIHHFHEFNYDDLGGVRIIL